MAISDSWIFSAHVVVGIMSDNRTSLPMLVPGFLSLCTAVVFGPVSSVRPLSFGRRKMADVVGRVEVCRIVTSDTSTRKV